MTRVPNPELEQLAVLAEVDDLTGQVERWIAEAPDWSVARKARSLVGRVMDRVRSLRIRLEAPLVVATFGGTGTGKSTLVNALVGQDVTAAGRQRPTTRIPILLHHVDLEPAVLGFDLSQFTVRSSDSPVLKDLVLIDCPDPDTSETAATGSNLALLRTIVPLCDVLIYVSTQQKYRSARVVEELGEAASACRLVFVQTHAETDSDIRDDWKRVLSGRWQVPDMFFVDSPRAFREQQSGQKPSGDFGRLVELLTNQLGASKRLAIRRANVADLLEDSLAVCREDYGRAMPAVRQLQSALEDQQKQLRESLTTQLLDELLQNRNLWERRLLSSVTDRWGFSPFSAVLRFYNGLGAFIASFSFFRARTSAQMALIGTIQGARWLKSRAEEQEAHGNLDRLSSFGISDQRLQESRLVMGGYVRAAGIEERADAADAMRPTGAVNSAGRLTTSGSTTSPRRDPASSARDLTLLRSQAASVESEFLTDARRGIDRLIEELAAGHCGWWTRFRYEFLFAAYLVFLIGRIGHNFFWSSFLAPLVRGSGQPEALLTIDFYIPAMIFLLIWSALLVLSFTWRLRGGMTGRIRRLAESLADSKLASGLFPSLENACRQIAADEQTLTALHDRIASFRRQLAGSSSFLGGRT